MSKNQEEKKKDPIPTVDLIVRKGDQIILERRGRPPFEGRLCIPGGHVDYGERVEEAALRELQEETSVRAKLVEILGVYSDPKRDPRGQRISTVFIADWVSGEPVGADDAASAEWVAEKDLRSKLESEEFAFDHSLIVSDYLMWKEKKDYSFWSSKPRSNN